MALDNDAYVQLPTSHTITNLPYFPQTEDQCGPASLATMLGKRGITVTAEELRDKVYIPDKAGSLTTEMAARARRYGMVAYPLSPKLPDILAEISADNPVLVLQNLGLDLLPRWHFSVAFGYDLQRQIIILRSGEHHSYEVGLPLFLKTWQRADNWAIVINNPDQLPQTARIPQYLDAINQLELVGETTAAQRAYKAAVQRWPASSLAYFGAGNTAYALAQYPDALNFYLAYIEREPNSPAGWNNLAYSLLKLDCPGEAAAAVNCAIKLGKRDTQYLDSHRQITSRQTALNQQSACTVPDCPL